MTKGVNDHDMLEISDNGPAVGGGGYVVSLVIGVVLTQSQRGSLGETRSTVPRGLP